MRIRIRTTKSIILSVFALKVVVKKGSYAFGNKKKTFESKNNNIWNFALLRGNPYR